MDELAPIGRGEKEKEKEKLPTKSRADSFQFGEIRLSRVSDAIFGFKLSQNDHLHALI